MISQPLNIKRSLDLLIGKLFIWESITGTVHKIQGGGGDLTAGFNVLNTTTRRTVQRCPNGGGSTRGNHLVLFLECN